jgi:hypothetical protein
VDGIGAASDEELDGAHDECLPRAGLSGERGHARLEDEAELTNDTEVLDPQLDEH